MADGVNGGRGGNGESKRPRPSTGSDVARLAGVSKSAVSRAFSNGIVKPATRERILAAASELKYRPSVAARSLSTSRSNLIGVAVTHLDNQFFPEFVETLVEHFGATGNRVLLFITRGETEHDPVLDELLRYRVDAVVLASGGFSNQLAFECVQTGVPAVMVNNADTTKRVPSITGADGQGAEVIADFLVAGGHRQFAYVSGLADSSTSWRRGQAYAARLRRHGMPAPRQVSGDYTFEGAAEAVRMLLRSDARPDAIFCANDHMALAALQVARSEFGIEVGRELSIVGFDDVAIASWPAFALTTFTTPMDALASAVVDHVLAMLDGSADAAQVEIGGDLVIRTSARIPAEGVVEEGGRRIWRSSK